MFELLNKMLARTFPCKERCLEGGVVAVFVSKDKVA